jgi:hypothetical protein
MESVVFLLFSSSIISMLGGKIQEPWIQKVNLGFILADPTKYTPTLALVLSESQFLLACASKIFSFINAVQIPSIS